MAGALLRRVVVRAPMAPRVDLCAKKMIVTGAATGSIGGETARILAAWGADVVITTRDDSAATAARLVAELTGVPGAGQVDAHPLDLSDARSVERFAGWYRERHGEQLDVLVNNAGVHLDLLSEWKQPKRLADGYEIHWRTNYLGTMHLTQLLLPMLCAAGERSGEARVVNVTSRLHSRGSNAGLLEPTVTYNSWVAYGLSKLALVHATVELQRRYAGSSHLQAYCLHPGEVFTGIASKGLAGHPWIAALRRVLRPLEAFFLLTPAEGAQTSVFAATQPGIEGGRYYVKCRPAEPAPDANDAETSARLWEHTQDWVSSVT